jgi:hypothetical protein
MHGIPSLAEVEYLLFLAMDMRTRVRRSSWFDGLDTLQPLCNCLQVSLHFGRAKCGRL